MNDTNTKFAVIVQSQINQDGKTIMESICIAKTFNTLQEAEDYIQTQLTEYKQEYYEYYYLEKRILERCLEITRNSITLNRPVPEGQSDVYRFWIDEMTIAA